MLLGRLVSDCQAYLDGYRYGIQRLYKSNIEEHISLMKDILLSIPQDQLTGDFTMGDIEAWKDRMEKYAAQHTQKFGNTN